MCLIAIDIYFNLFILIKAVYVGLAATILYIIRLSTDNQCLSYLYVVCQLSENKIFAILLLLCSQIADTTYVFINMCMMDDSTI